MNVILTCFQSGEHLHPLTRDLPVAMLPVFNYPLIQHHLETFVELRCTRFTVAVVENPSPLKDFLGDGSRWGSTIDVLVLKEPCTSSEILDRLAPKMNGNLVIVVPAEALVDVDYKDLLKFHESHPGFSVRILAGQMLTVLEGSSTTNPRFHGVSYEEPLDSGMLLSRHGPSPDAPCIDYIVQGILLRITDSRTLWAANMAALGGQFPFLIKRRASGAEGDVLVGHHLQIARDAVVTGPVLLGNHVKVHAGATIQIFSVLGDGVIVDRRAQVRASVVTEHTYIGEDASVENSIVAGRLIYNVTIGQWVEVMDQFLLATTSNRLVAPWLGKVLERTIAFALFVLTGPLWISVGLWRVAKGKSFFDAHEVLVTDETTLLRLRTKANKVRLLGFGSPHTFIGRLPALLAVINGRLRLVGVRPLEHGDLPVYREDWAQLRGHAPSGLFTPVDAEGLDSATEEEKIVAENYYAVTRSFVGDVTIFFRSLYNLIRRRW